MSSLRTGAALAILGLGTVGPVSGQTTIDTGSPAGRWDDFMVTQSFTAPSDPFLMTFVAFAGWDRPDECSSPPGYIVVNGQPIPMDENRPQCLAEAGLGNFSAKVIDSGYNVVASSSTGLGLVPGEFSPFMFVFAQALTAGETYTIQINGAASEAMVIQSLYYGTTANLYSGGTLGGGTDQTRDLAFRAQFIPDPYAPDPSVTVTPEPVSMALLGTGLLGVVGAARRRRGRERSNELA